MVRVIGYDEKASETRTYSEEGYLFTGSSGSILLDKSGSVLLDN